MFGSDRQRVWQEFFCFFKAEQKPKNPTMSATNVVCHYKPMLDFIFHIPKFDRNRKIIFESSRFPTFEVAIFVVDSIAMRTQARFSHVMSPVIVCMRALNTNSSILIQAL